MTKTGHHANTVPTSAAGLLIDSAELARCLQHATVMPTLAVARFLHYARSVPSLPVACYLPMQLSCQKEFATDFKKCELVESFLARADLYFDHDATETKPN